MKKIDFKPTYKQIIFLMLMLVTNIAMGQGTHPGADPTGGAVPLDGAALIALLGGAGVLTMVYKNRKEKDKDKQD